ncbi:MAG: NUDIX hydrolase [Chloroflexi bacterium]|nr:NUDIX hydrolase [Chloroflexota bacterium]
MVVRRGHQVLIIQRAKGLQGGGYWAPPSGKVELGETQPDAVIREVAEETGLVVQPLRKVWECVSASGAFALHWWLTEYLRGALTPDPREVSAAAWMSAEEFAALAPIFDGDLEFFRDVFPRL